MIVVIAIRVRLWCVDDESAGVIEEHLQPIDDDRRARNRHVLCTNLDDRLRIVVAVHGEWVRTSVDSEARKDSRANKREAKAVGVSHVGHRRADRACCLIARQGRAVAIPNGEACIAGLDEHVSTTLCMCRGEHERYQQEQSEETETRDDRRKIGHGAGWMVVSGVWSRR